MNKSGFVKIDRKITEWEWYKVVNTRALFEHLIYIANYEDKKWQGITIQRGQVVTSIKSLSDEEKKINKQNNKQRNKRATNN